MDCVDGRRARVEGAFRVGSTVNCDLRVEASGREGELFRLQWANGSYFIQAAGHGPFYFDGQEVYAAELGDMSEHTLVAGGHPFVVRLADEQTGSKWLGGVDVSQWWVYRRSGQMWTGPVPLKDITVLASPVRGETITLCLGMGEMGFYTEQILERIRVAKGGAGANNGTGAPPPPLPTDEPMELSEINGEYGDFTCPVCWFRFDSGDVMSIAVHPSLLGDPVLGPDQLQRFHATRFNDRGQALDAMGLVAPEITCPHCRRKLPTGFLEQPHHIFSIVGAPTSGKSYYLSVLVKMLQNRLFRDFGVSFRDAAPSENAVLNDMKRHLFSASTPEDAYLAKTDLEGALYEMLPRQGRQVKLPKPFIFKVSRDDQEDGFAVVFYDNAGEHFEPGRNSADSPGAQHLAVASGIFFLFDPLFHDDFRRLLQDRKDPQLLKHVADQQDLILSESEVRIKEILGLAAREKISTPLAVIVGKADAWLHLLPGGPLLEAISDEGDGARVQLRNLEANSARIRKLLLEVCPAIVSNAEAISSVVSYFAASPLGHAPVTFIDRGGEERIGPDPKLLKPERVEDATLWVLAKIAPAMIPSNN